MILTPPFPLVEEPGTWDELTLLAATILLEAEAEPPDGQLAVGSVFRFRAELLHQTIRQAVLGPEGLAYGDGHAFEAASAWNDDYRPMARARLAGASDAAREAAWRAAAAALWRLLPDPAPGAYFYLNPELTRRIRGGTLPTWAATPGDATKLDREKLIAVIGRHAFLAA